MALQRQKASVDFIKGADTKTNGIITENFQDMENVVFTGDLTVKKMPGYDLTAALPENIDTSILFKRDTDMLAQTSSATYKYFSNISTFKKISDIGSADLTDRQSPGQFFVAGTSYNAYFKTMWDGQISTSGAGTTGTVYGKWTFTDKTGNVINQITIPVGGSVYAIEPLWDAFTKGASIGDKFYFSCSALDGQTLQIVEFTYNSGANQFQLNSQYVFSTIASHQQLTYVAGVNQINSIDMIADGTYLYFACYAASGNKFYKFTPGLSTPVITTISETITSNLELHDYDATYILMSASTVSSLVSTLKLRKYLKSNLTFVSEVTLGTQSYDSGTLTSSCIWSCFPLSTTTAIFYPILVGTAINSAAISGTVVGYDSIRKGASILNGNIYDGLIPIGKIFTYNNKYFAHFMQSLGEDRTNLVIDIQTGSIRGIFNISPLYSTPAVFQLSTRKLFSLNSGLDLYGNPTYIVPGFYPLQEQYLNNGDYIFESFDDSGGTNEASLSFGSSYNSSIEISNKCFLSGATPCQFDGVTFSENDLIGAPFLSYRGLSSGGALIADNNYQIVAIFEWKDSTGCSFKSRLSNVLGVNVALAVSTNQQINLDVYMPIVTQRDNVFCKIYIKRAVDSAFKLASTTLVKYSSISTRVGIILSYNPNSESEVLYTQGVGLGEVQKQYFPATSIKSTAIYSDRIFYIKNGDNDRVYFSFPKVRTEGFEFYETGFYLDSYDKRGTSQDNLMGLQGMDGRLLIFKENSILYTVGVGPSLNNQNTDLLPPQLITTDVGCVAPKSIILTPAGVMFKSDKGIYLLDRKLQVSYIGSSVERFNYTSITSAILLETKNEIRFTTIEGFTLVYNYYSNAWSWFTNLTSSSSLIINNNYRILTTQGYLLQESATHNKINGVAITQKISSPWIRGGGDQWWQKVFDLTLVGKYKSEHQIKVSMYFDYELYADAVYLLDPLTSGNYNILTRPTNGDIESGASVDGVYQLQIDIPRKACQAFRFVIEDVPLNIASNSGESFALASFQIVYGVKNGPAKIPNVKTY